MWVTLFGTAHCRFSRGIGFSKQSKSIVVQKGSNSSYEGRKEVPVSSSCSIQWVRGVLTWATSIDGGGAIQVSNHCRKTQTQWAERAATAAAVKSAWSQFRQTGLLKYSEEKRITMEKKKQFYSSKYSTHAVNKNTFLSMEQRKKWVMSNFEFREKRFSFFTSGFYYTQCSIF